MHMMKLQSSAIDSTHILLLNSPYTNPSFHTGGKGHPKTVL